jgi:hypothetical protein
MKRVFALVLVAASLAGCKKGDASSVADAKVMLSDFTKPGADQAALFAAWRPKAEDYEAVFVGDAAAKAKAAMDPLFEGSKGLGLAPEQTEIDVVAVTPAQLAKGEGPAASCPPGYKDIADKINPKVTVYCFHIAKPGTKGGLAGDALVHLDDHWAYFPKPFRWLR